MSRAVQVGATIFLLSVFRSAAADSDRWYRSDQVESGAPVYAQNCAECHGANGEAKPDWRTPDPQGKYPPPPLNGTAHAWHHPMDILRRTIRDGGTAVGGQMPPFKDKLSAQQIDAVIAYFQSKWPDRIYQAWQERDKGSAGLQPVATTPRSEPITERLKIQAPNVSVGEPVATPVTGIFQVKLGPDYAYLTRDGRYAFIGTLVDLEEGRNLTGEQKNRDTLSALSAFPEKDRVVYPAQGDEKIRLQVFTDTSCPYCRKLHTDVPTLQSAGVSLSYIPFPRAGSRGEGYRDLRSVWCAEDRRAAMDIAKGASAGELGTGDCKAAQAVDAGYRLGRAIGIKGTPAIVFPDGNIQPGYLPATTLLSRLGLAPVSVAR